MSRAIVGGSFLATFFLCTQLLAQTHAGQMDTDGILSEGELRNPAIDYDKAQRDAGRAGDERLENPYNDSAAEHDRESERDERGRYDWERDSRDYDEREPRNDYPEDDRERGSSWWFW